MRLFVQTINQRPGSLQGQIEIIDPKKQKQAVAWPSKIRAR
jgi:hypothetical protein